MKINMKVKSIKWVVKKERKHMNKIETETWIHGTDCQWSEESGVEGMEERR